MTAPTREAVEDAWVIDLFAGGGGWDEGARLAGYVGPLVGIEWDTDACATAEAAGHTRIQADVAAYDPSEFAGRADGLIASPPCQSWSAAGSRKGLDDPRGELVWQPLRWATALRPRWVACEQVPAVLPIWRIIATHLRDLGYSTWTGEMNAADFGVGQDRRRAILIARRDGLQAHPPEPSHSEYGGDSLFGEVTRWRSMADVLGWGMTGRPYFTVATAGGKRGGADEQVGGSGARRALYSERAAGRWIEPTDGRAGRPVRPTVQEVAMLQGFPADYPWTGSQTTQFQQVGNAVPPPLAAAVLMPLLAVHSAECAA